MGWFAPEALALKDKERSEARKNPHGWRVPTSEVAFACCHGPSAPQPDTPNFGAEEKIGLSRSG